MNFTSISLIACALVCGASGGEVCTQQIAESFAETSQLVAEPTHHRFLQAQQATPRFRLTEVREPQEIVCSIPLPEPPEKRLERAKANFKKGVPVEFRRFVEQEASQARAEIFIQKLSAYYREPTRTHLDALILIVEEEFSQEPERIYVVTQFAAALGNGLSRKLHSDVAKSKAWSEKALQMLESTEPPSYWPPDYAYYRDTMLTELAKYRFLYR